MSTPTGQISANNVENTLNEGLSTNYPGGTSRLTFNDGLVRTLASKPSGAISMNDMRGKAGPAAYGSLISQSCSGTTLTRIFADGLYGTYTATTVNSPTCGYKPTMLVGIGWYNPVYSTDGINWTQGDWGATLKFVNPGQLYQWMFAACYGNGKFVVATNGSYPTTKIIYSTDGINWTASGTSPINAAFKAGAYGNGVYVLVSNQGGQNMITSTDGINWTARTVSNGSWDQTCLTFANGIFLMVDSSGNYVARSTNGTTWSTSTAMPSRNWKNAAYGSNIWVAVSPVGSQYATSSDNGVTWTARTLPVQKDLVNPQFNSPGGFSMVCFGRDRFVGISNSAYPGYSLDGINWTMATGSVPNGSWWYIIYEASLDLFIAVANSGQNNNNNSPRCMTSTDGINWTIRTIPSATGNGTGPFALISKV